MRVNKKKILFFLYTLTGGGAERTVVNIINNLNKEKFEVVLVLGTDRFSDYINLISSAVRVKLLHSQKLRFCIFKLRNIIVMEKPDVIFSTINNNNIALLLAKLLCFKKPKAIVRESNNRTESGKVTKLNKLITKFTYNFLADKIVALSQGVKEDLVNHFFIKSNLVEVIYNPIEIKSIQKMSNELVDDYNFDSTTKTIISVGRLVEQKDMRTLLNAFAVVSKAINTKLVILGKGSQEKELRMLTERLNLEKDVYFLGFKNNPYKYMKRADLFVLSSKWEGFGHVITEAMVVGTPVLSTNCNSGPFEIIKNNQFGVLTPVGDYKMMAEKIIEILNNDNLIESLSKKGVVRSKDFDALVITKKYENLFINIAE